MYGIMFLIGMVLTVVGWASVVYKAPAREIVAVLLGFLAASLIPPAVMSFGFPLNDDRTIGTAFVSFLIVYPFSAGFVLLLGGPAFLLLRPFRPGRWWSVLAVGFLLGILVAVALRLPGQPNPRDVLLTGPLAAASTFVFWLIWRRSQQSRD
jgi:hypothetical protein